MWYNTYSPWNLTGDLSYLEGVFLLRELIALYMCRFSVALKGKKHKGLLQAGSTQLLFVLSVFQFIFQTYIFWSEIRVSKLWQSGISPVVMWVCLMSSGRNLHPSWNTVFCPEEVNVNHRITAPGTGQGPGRACWCTGSLLWAFWRLFALLKSCELPFRKLMSYLNDLYPQIKNIYIFPF